MSETEKENRAVGRALERLAVPTHWMDDRGYTVTDDWLQNDPRSTPDWKLTYNIPCRKVRGKIVPISGHNVELRGRAL